MLLHPPPADPDAERTTAPPAELDLARLPTLAMRLLDAPVSVVSLVDGDRPLATGGTCDTWRRRREAPLRRTLCGVAAGRGRPLVTADARRLTAVRDDPELWLGEVAYAGIPFAAADGRVAGTLCVADARRRRWTEEEVDHLSSLARLAALLLSERERGGGLERVLAAAAESASGGVSLRMLRTAVETMQLGVTITDLAGRILYCNPADAAMHGYAPGELEGRDARLFAPPEHARPRHPERIGKARSWSRETINLRRDGSRFPVLLRSDVVHDGEGRPVAFVTCCEDLTPRRELERELLRTAFYDPVTGLPNRGLLSHRLELTLEAARRDGPRAAVVAVELDRIGLVRDSLGRAGADELLRGAGRRLRGCTPPEGMLAALGQDRFALLVERPAALSTAARVRDAFAAPLTAGGEEVFSEARVGMVLCAGEYASPDEVLRDAEIAVVRARDGGDGACRVFEPSMHAAVLERLQLETALRRAVERGELRVHYQPIVRLDTGRVSGFEALARWMHPERGLLLPDEFIPLAEETGVILPIGVAVLEEACRTLARWQRTPGGERLRMAVNLSARQLAGPELAGEVERVTRETRIAPGTLELEITESVLLPDLPHVLKTLHDLKGLGAALHVDDFGTGYSSLSYLHRLPLDALKIDRSFVSGGEPEGRPIVRTIVAMAHALGVAVIGEGIESAETLAELRALSCDYGQGYHFCRPCDAAAIEARMRAWPAW